MKKIIALFIFTLSFIFTVGLTSCKSKIDSETAYTEYTPEAVDVSNITFVNPGKLTVAVSTDFAPMEFIDLTKQGQAMYTGADIQLAKTLAAAFNLTLEIKAMDFDATMVALDNNLCDLAISGFSYTEDRASTYQYSACYYAEGDGGQVVVVKKSDATKYTTLASLNNSSVKVAAQNGALQQALVTEQLPNATLNKVDDLNATLTALKSGSIDAIAIAKTVADAWLAKEPNEFVIVPEAFEIVDEGNFVLAKLGNTQLIAATNTVINAMPKNLFSTWVAEAKIVFAGLGSKGAGELIPEEE